MSRWRDVKAGKSKNTTEKKQSSTFDNKEISASIPARVKAFIVDMFMIMMPLAYITTYVLMDGKEDFQASQEARWAISLIFGAITIIFWVAKGQTPGQKAYEVKLIDQKTRKKISFLKALVRYFIFLISAVTIILSFIPFFRKDKKTVQDILTNTIVVDEKNI